MVSVLSLYHVISFPAQKLFQQYVKTLAVKRGDFLLLDGDIQRQLFLVKQGVLMMYLDADKGSQAIDFSYQNRFCVDIGSFSQQIPSRYCIQSLCAGEVEAIDYADLENLFDQVPAIERAYRMLLERILASAVEHHLNLGRLSIQERFELLMHKRPELFRLVPHKYIASYLHMDPTNFSKLYNQSCNNGDLRYS